MIHTQFEKTLAAEVQQDIVRLKNRCVRCVSAPAGASKGDKRMLSVDARSLILSFRDYTVATGNLHEEVVKDVRIALASGRAASGNITEFERAVGLQQADFEHFVKDFRRRKANVNQIDWKTATLSGT